MTSREEVAKKLREGGIARNEAEAYVLLLHCIGIRPQLPAVNTYKPALERLADLIDPTCKPHITSEILTESITKYTAECSNCGAIFGDFPTMEQAKTTHPVYCPSCGARVVSDDDMKEPKTVEEQTVLPSSDYVDNQTLALAT